ncbi:tRNA uridine 5-carboxymethylaminomethyl modification enzyme [Frankliniella fusca]|uniref:tRNA uridine 5-carboxymethylaminomethyl modification enzyme n=1 Tax=Frankliniella fusca TaxID=407009 RepID=A0AAE1L9P1_9NEOP|nr:tRNA uridine 5-carboxymethylaminomethyl modification enzyme [Frankliniella fusca]
MLHHRTKRRAAGLPTLGYGKHLKGLGSPQGQPQAGSPSTPGPASNGTHTNTITITSGKHRNRGWRDWRKDDPTRHNSLWKSVTPLGNAEMYIVFALLIGLVTVVIGCWLSDNCWSPEPEIILPA